MDNAKIIAILENKYSIVMEEVFSPPVSDSCYRIVALGIYCCRTERDRDEFGQRIISIRENVTHLMPRIPANRACSATSELLKFKRFGKYMWPSNEANSDAGFCWGIYRIKKRYRTTNDITDKQLLKLVACWRDRDLKKSGPIFYCKNNDGVKDYQVFVLDLEHIFPQPICDIKNYQCYKYYSLEAVFRNDLK